MAKFPERLRDMAIDKFNHEYEQAQPRFYPFYDQNAPKRATFMNDVFGFLRDLLGDFARWLYKKTHGLDPLTTIRDLRQDLELANQSAKFLRGELHNVNTRAKDDSKGFKELYGVYNRMKVDITAVLQKAVKKPLTVRDYAKFNQYGIVLTVVPKKKKAK